jgi:predicted MPP superfamily phosphohydrolase
VALSTIFVLGGYAAVVLAGMRRSKTYGKFTAIVLAFPTLVGLALAGHLPLVGAVMPLLLGVTYLHFFTLGLRPRLWPWPVRVLVTWPALWLVGATLIAWPWALLAAVGLPPWGAWIPFGLAGLGLVQSLWTRETIVDLSLDNAVDTGALSRGWPAAEPPTTATGRPLTIVQITDPHIGPFMSVDRLRRICQRAVERAPDLILITGDLMTMESERTEIVVRALQPLAGYTGKVFACHGNHDLEAREVVRRAYAKLGIRLLVDEAEIVQTPSGPVQILGVDFVWRGRDVHLADVCRDNPRVDGALRLLLLHDPGAFRHLPEGEGDLVLSGHTHGGQVGLVSFGLPHTFVSLFTDLPDHGPWSRGRDRLYVHRAQGHYGYPIRLGVPAENSLMRVHRS